MHVHIYDLIIITRPRVITDKSWHEPGGFLPRASLHDYSILTYEAGEIKPIRIKYHNDNMTK